MEIAKNKKRKGFSLIEVILALFVLTVGIGAVMSLMGASMSDSIRNRDSIVATQLAQEGAELIRGEDKNGEITSPANQNYTVDIEDDLTDGLLDGASGSDPYLLYEKNGTRLYAHSGSGASPSKFRRKVTRAADLGGNQHYLVKVWWGGEADAPGDCSLATKCVGEDLYAYGEQEAAATPPPSTPGTCDVASSPLKSSIACSPYSISSHLVNVGGSVKRIDYNGGREEEIVVCISDNTWGSTSGSFFGGAALDVTQWEVTGVTGFYDEIDCS